MSNKSYMVIDIDGTIADCSHRLKHIVDPFSGEKHKKADWNSFYQGCIDDVPRQKSIDFIVRQAKVGVDVIWLTGRPSFMRDDTIKWLEANVPSSLGTNLYMREAKDFRPASELKLEIFKNDILPNIGTKTLMFIMDDDDKILKAFSDEGFPTLDAKLFNES